MKEKRKFVIEEDDLVNLLTDSLELECLKSDGVDNWTWYRESYHEMVADYFDISTEEAEDKDLTFEDVARNILIAKYREV